MNFPMPDDLLYKALGFLEVRELAIGMSVSSHTKQACEVSLARFTKVVIHSKSDSLAYIAKRCPNMRRVRVVLDGNNVPHEDVTALLDRCGKLEQYGSHVVARALVNSTRETLPSLTHLRMVISEDAGLVTLAQRCQNLIDLRLLCVGASRRRAMRSLGSVLEANPSLETLVLVDFWMGRVWQLEQLGCLQSLKSLSLQRASVTNDGCGALGRSLPHLENLSLDENYDISEESIRTLSRHMLDLRTLSLKGCPDIRISNVLNPLVFPKLEAVFAKDHLFFPEVFNRRPRPRNAIALSRDLFKWQYDP